MGKEAMTLRYSAKEQAAYEMKMLAKRRIQDIEGHEGRRPTAEDIVELIDQYMHTIMSDRQILGLESIRP
jgi:hypothetical protein